MAIDAPIIVNFDSIAKKYPEQMLEKEARKNILRRDVVPCTISTGTAMNRIAKMFET